MAYLTLTSARLLRRETKESRSGGSQDPGSARVLVLSRMVDTARRVRNDDAPWPDFSPQEYWRRNYETMHPEDREIIRRVSRFFIRAFTHRDRAKRAIDVGSGSNLYPALLMLPFADQILLTDHSEPNVSWLRNHIMDDEATWTWQPFWEELGKCKAYDQISEVRKQLRVACASEPEYAGIEQRNVFSLPKAQWQLGTMFFVAESITQDPAEFRAAIGRFVGALEPGAPFAATFMAGSEGYPVADTRFPALKITRRDVRKNFKELGARKLKVYRNRTHHRVREGYQGMIVAIGIVGGR